MYTLHSPNPFTEWTSDTFLQHQHDSALNKNNPIMFVPTKVGSDVVKGASAENVIRISIVLKSSSFGIFPSTMCLVDKGTAFIK